MPSSHERAAADRGAEDPVVAYLSDAEGLWSKLVTFTEGNPHVALDERGRLRVAPGAVFVFGGDAIDRGPEARRLVAALLEVKGRQPGQVILLAGNRDINKLRLRRELGGHPPRRTPEHLRDASRGELLRWILSNTMGAKEAFACRRSELARAGEADDDEAVVASFLDDLRPEGELSRYLAACQLMYRAGSTLFVHGGVTDENLGRVPGLERVFDNVSEWEAELNRWYREQMAAYEANAMTAAGEPAWGPLVAYQAPLPGTKLNQSSVVYARPTDDEGNPSLPSVEVMAALGRSGVRRLVVGHTPVGDSPALLRTGDFELLAADNSYSPVEAGSRIYLRDELLESVALTRLHGHVESVIIRQVFGDSSPVGLRVAGSGHLVKGLLPSGDFLLHRSEANFRVDHRPISPHELRALSLIEARRR